MRKTFAAAVLIFTANLVFAQDMFYIERGDTIFLSSQKSARSGDDGWLVTQHGNRVKIAEGIIVELKNGISAQYVFSKYEIKSFEELSQNIFLVIPKDNNKQFELSRELLKDGLVKNSHPNLIREIRPR